MFLKEKTDDNYYLLGSTQYSVAHLTASNSVPCSLFSLFLLSNLSPLPHLFSQEHRMKAPITRVPNSPVRKLQQRSGLNISPVKNCDITSRVHVQHREDETHLVVLFYRSGKHSPDGKPNTKIRTTNGLNIYQINPNNATWHQLCSLLIPPSDSEFFPKPLKKLHLTSCKAAVMIRGEWRKFRTCPNRIKACFTLASKYRLHTFLNEAPVRALHSSCVNNLILTPDQKECEESVRQATYFF